MTNPNPNHLELPSTEVIDCPNHPPVHDSATVKKRFLERSKSPSLELNKFKSDVVKIKSLKFLNSKY